VREAIGSDDFQAREALTMLCNAYWYPLYAYIRRTGKSPHDAEDLTQAFFLQLIKKKILSAADPSKGKLRTFLLTCLQHFLADNHDRAVAKKRGGPAPVEVNVTQAEELYATEPVDTLSPDRLFQRRWALTVLEYSMQLLEEEFTATGRQEVFAALRPFLGFSPDSTKRYDEIAVTLGTAVGTLKNQVFRMRKRWRELLFEQVAMTLDNPTPEEVKLELTELFDYV